MAWRIQTRPSAAGPRFFDHVPPTDENLRGLIRLHAADPDPEVRAAAIHVLGCEGCKPEGGWRDRLHGIRGRQTMLRAATGDPSARVRGRADDADAGDAGRKMGTSVRGGCVVNFQQPPDATAGWSLER